MRDIRLKRQLRVQASTRQEADDLAELARSLRQAPMPHLGQDAKDDIAERLGLHPKRYQVGRRLGLAASFAVVAILVVIVQTAAPGSSLHDVRSALTKLMPWSQQSQPLSPPLESDDRPLRPILTPPATTDDSDPDAPTLQGSAKTPQPGLSPLQSGDSTDINRETLPNTLNNILLQPLSDPTLPSEGL